MMSNIKFYYIITGSKKKDSFFLNIIYHSKNVTETSLGNNYDIVNIFKTGNFGNIYVFHYRVSLIEKSSEVQTMLNCLN